MNPKDLAYKIFCQDSECITTVVSRKKDDYTEIHKIVLKRKHIERSDLFCVHCGSKMLYTTSPESEVTPEYNLYCVRCNALFSVNLDLDANPEPEVKQQ